MTEPFAQMLAVGGRSNSLGRVDEVIALVLADRARLDEVYGCLFEADPWIRMRAADALEKVCRERPDWLVPYVDRFLGQLGGSGQPSIQWHLAQIYRQVPLTPGQKAAATAWLEGLLSTTDVDWIVAANAMWTLAAFTRDGSFPRADLVTLLRVQQHRSKSVVRRAGKLLEDLSGRPS
jgi:hypothetical protein